MTNSMALWYKPWRETATDGQPAEVQVHLNLWRHTTSEASDSNFLDVGLLFSNAYEVGTVCLYVPAPIADNEIQDLSETLRNDTLLSAVFNDVVTRATPEDDYSFATSCKGKHFLTFHNACLGIDFKTETIDKTNVHPGITLEFGSKFCERLRAPGRHYIRLRFNLSEAAAAEFSTKKEARGHFFVTSLWREEFTELRFNEMRNLPPTIASKIGAKDSRMFNMTEAHCFLIRDMSFELVASHASMHKMRRMEAKLWKGYLPERLSKVDLEKMMVYHWRGVKAPIENFISLARFRSPRDTLYQYIFGAVALGALGSAFEAWIAGWCLPQWSGGGEFGALGALLALVPLAVLFYFFPAIFFWVWKKIARLKLWIKNRR